MYVFFVCTLFIAERSFVRLSSYVKTALNAFAIKAVLLVNLDFDNSEYVKD